MLCVRRTPTFIPTEGICTFLNHYAKYAIDDHHVTDVQDAAHLRWRLLQDVRTNEVVLPVLVQTHDTPFDQRSDANEKMHFKSRNQKTELHI